MDYCTKHLQFYYEYCAYCGSPFIIQKNATTSAPLDNPREHETNYHQNELDTCGACGGYDGCLKGCNAPCCRKLKKDSKTNQWSYE